jgi:hypothetical protein
MTIVFEAIMSPSNEDFADLFETQKMGVNDLVGPFFRDTPLTLMSLVILAHCHGYPLSLRGKNGSIKNQEACIQKLRVLFQYGFDVSNQHYPSPYFICKEFNYPLVYTFLEDMELVK